jgi:hypothetical protein
MRLEGQHVLRSSIRVAKALVTFGLLWLLVGVLVLSLGFARWYWALVFLGCSAVAAGWASWRGSSLLEALLGIESAVLIMVGVAFASTARFGPIAGTDMVVGPIFALVSCGAAAAAGHYVGGLLRSGKSHDAP